MQNKEHNVLYAVLAALGIFTAEVIFGIYLYASSLATSEKPLTGDLTMPRQQYVLGQAVEADEELQEEEKHIVFIKK